MLPKILILIFIIGASLSFVLWDMTAQPTLMQSTEAPQAVELSIKPKPFVFQTLAGEENSSDSMHGKIVVLNFWASWCTPCIKEFPDLITLTSAYTKDVVFLALSVDEKKENAARFIANFAPQENRIIGFDTEKKIAQDIFQTTMYPETYILDRDFTIRRHIIGVIDWTSPEVKTALESLIARKGENP